MNKKIIIPLQFVIIALFLCFSVVQSFAQENKELVIVAFGNSTTAPRKGVEKVFSVRLHEILNEMTIPNKVINSGVGSSHTGSIKDNDFAKVIHGMDRFNESVLAHHPDLVTINFGLNDAYQDGGLNATSRIPIEDYKRNLSYFIDKIQEQNGKVILLPPNPIGAKLEEFRYKRVKEYVKAAKKMARKKKIPFLNTWKVFYKEVKGNPKKIDALLMDGVHPGDRGHELIANELAKIIVDVYKLER